MAAKLFSYDPRLLSDRDWVRYYVGDTAIDHAEADDRELDALLVEEPTPELMEAPTAADWRSYRKLVASRAAAAIAAKYAKESDVSFDSQRTALSAKFAQYTKLAEQLRTEAVSALTGGVGGGMIPVVRW